MKSETERGVRDREKQGEKERKEIRGTVQLSCEGSCFGELCLGCRQGCQKDTAATVFNVHTTRTSATAGA